MNRQVLLTVLMAWITTAIGQQSNSGSCDSLPPQGQFTLDETIDYLSHDTTQTVGHLVLAPELRFTCHGYITGWSAITRLSDNANVDDGLLDNVDHDITFQIWRPTTRDNLYSLVGAHVVDFIGTRLRNVLTIVNGTKFLNFTDAAPASGDDTIIFQPGDIVGWYIHTTVQEVEQPMTVIYRELVNETDSSLQPVDLYSTVIPDTDGATTAPPCDLSIHSDRTRHIPSVIPYVSVHYTELSVSERMCTTTQTMIHPSATTTPLQPTVHPVRPTTVHSVTSPLLSSRTRPSITLAATPSLSQATGLALTSLEVSLLVLVVLLTLVTMSLATLVIWLLATIKKHQKTMPLQLRKNNSGITSSKDRLTAD